MADQTNSRKADYPIEPMFLERWSPRAFTGEAIGQEELFAILEAARWAPSSYNGQPWRFLYARRDTPQWDKFLDLLAAMNRSWAQHAAALIVIVSKPDLVPPGSDTPVPSHTHSFDTGTASGYLAMQATLKGWYAHGMVGFDMERAFTELAVPAGYRVEAAYAIGRKGDPAQLPDMLRAREMPNDRKPLSEIAFEGGFPAEHG